MIAVIHAFGLSYYGRFGWNLMKGKGTKKLYLFIYFQNYNGLLIY